MSVLIHVKTLKTTTPLVWTQGLTGKQNKPGKYKHVDPWFVRYVAGLEPPRFPVPAVTKPAYFHLNFDGFEGIYIDTPNGDGVVGWFNEP